MQTLVKVQLGQLETGQTFRFYCDNSAKQFVVKFQRDDNITWYEPVELDPFRDQLDWLMHDTEVYIDNTKSVVLMSRIYEDYSLECWKLVGQRDCENFRKLSIIRDFLLLANNIDCELLLSGEQGVIKKVKEIESRIMNL